MSLAASHAAPTSGRRRGVARRLARVLAAFALVLLSLLYLAPLAFMALTSLKTDAEAVAVPPAWLPRAPTFAAYEAIFAAADAPVLRWLVNSVLVASAQAALVVITSALAAYALARLELRGGRALFALVVATLFIPPVTFLAPSFLVVSELGLVDSLWAVILPGSASAFGVFFLRQLFLAVPRELEEAALLDGAGRLRVFWSVVLPLARPGLATLALLAFLASWNDFLWPLYVLVTPSQLTLPAGLTQLQGAYTTHYPAIMAGAVVTSVPALVLFLLAQRRIIEGVARTGLTG